MIDRDREVVMIVDDEEMVTAALERFLTMETPYRILAFNAPASALAALDSGPVDVIVADFMMPGMDGIQFLTHARERSPETTRILLTGYADKENAIRAINEAGLYYYLEKPWDNERLKLVLRNGIERCTLFRDLQAQMSALAGAHEDLNAIRQRLTRVFL